MSSFVKLASMPSNLNDVAKGATPLWFGVQTMEPYSKDKIVKVLLEEMNNPVFTAHIPGERECFDRAFWGISVLRCKLPGMPAGIAYGIAKEGAVANLADPRHAVIYYWYMENNQYTMAMFDPQIGPITQFDAKAFIGFPICRPNFKIGGNPIGECKLLPPFGDTIGDGKIMMYNNFETDAGYEVANFGNIMADLKSKRFNSCTRPSAKKELDIYTKKRTREDRVFWLFNQLRKKYNRSAIGFAWGTMIKETNILEKDSAVLVIWSSRSDFILWDEIKGKEIDKGDFKAKFLVG